MGENTESRPGENIGKWGEEQAIGYLKAHNYAILATNWRYKRLEVDIIAKIGNIMVFVEVKTRSSQEFGEPESFVSMKKQSFIISAANQYLIEKELDLEARFDIISVLIFNGKTTINHLPEAFYPIAK